MKLVIQLFLLCTLCIFSAGGSAPAFSSSPPNPFLVVEGQNFTLEWKYNFGDGSFKQIVFGNADTGFIVDKDSAGAPYIAPAYRGRLLVNVTDSYTSITFLGVKRTDSTNHTLTIKSRNRERAESKVKISVEYLYHPKITSQPLNPRLKEGDEVGFSCAVDGKPDPTISWTRNGSPMHTNGNSRISFLEGKKQLTITNVSRTDSGEYRCVTNNSLGNATSNFVTLDVQYQPEFTAHPQSVAKPEGDNVTLSCNTTGNPLPTISWTKHESPVDTSNNSRTSFSEDKKQLTITNVNRTDSGAYRCVASNSLGNDTSDAAILDIQYKPEITGLPPSVARPEGDNVTLSCNAEGNPVPTISWIRSGSHIDTSGNSSRIRFSEDKKQLTITNVNRTDSGEYRCVANNSLGKTSSSSKLDALYEPEFTAHPQNVTKPEGANVTLSCEADGYPVPTISWTRNGSTIYESINSRIRFSADKQQLNIANVKRTDSGEYRCVANNSLGNDNSNAATMNIQYKPEITVHLLNETKTEGKTVTLSCDATGNPVPTISWTRNGSSVDASNNSRISFSEDKKKLTITNVNRTDSGKYQCVASNKLGNDTSNAKLDVQYQPKITVYPQGRTVTEGNDVTLSCDATGNPVPTITWIRNGSLFNASNNSRIRFSKDKKQLNITNVSRTDSGEYQCVVSNSLGNDTSNGISLDVQYKPKITFHPLNETKTEGNNVTLSCNAEGNPVPTVSWTRNGSLVDTSNNSRISFSVDKKQLTITNVNRTDSGEYQCVANNSLGNDTSNAGTLDIQYQPEITVHPQAQTKTEGDNVALFCNADGNPVPTISWTRNGSLFNSSNNSRIRFSKDKKQLNITNVSRTDSGQYRCVAKNSLGRDTSLGATIKVHYIPDVTIFGDPEQFAVVGKQILLTCQYDASPPASEVLWKKDGTVIARNASTVINDSRVTITHYNESQVQLSITATTSQDAGNYTCLVTNDVGNSSDTTSMISQEQPSITVQPREVTIREGEDITLSCNASGNPAPTISWTRNGSPLDTSNNSRISFSVNNKQLTITNGSRTDRGEYRCVAKNRVGNATSNASTVNVQFEPAVTIDGNQTQYVANRSDILLTCQYDASPPASEVLWKKDGTVITRNASTVINDSRVTITHYNESQVQLSITATTSQDAGSYTCLVINEVGNSTDTAIIVIEEKPSITAHPQGVNVTEGKNVTLSCDATGSPVLTISWTRNGSPISTSDNSRISFLDENKQLIITNSSRTDSGEYRCVVKNRVGNDSSNAATVNVQYKPDITVHPKAQAATEGNNATFTCNAIGNPVTTISWTINGSSVDASNNSRISFSEGKKQLTITNVNRTDSGEYQCVASNSLGNDTSNTATLDVQYPPEITAHPQSETKTEGDNVTLSCNANGNPVPTISWTTNGSGVHTSNNSRISFSEGKKLLTITNVSRTDSGEYQCVANNKVGTAISNAVTLDVLYQAEITVHPKNKTRIEGVDVTFSCNATGNPKPTISWSRSGSPVHTSNNSRFSFSEGKKELTITNVNRTDSGKYQCVASNSLGNDTSDAATLNVQYKPDITVHPQADEATEGNNATFTCNAIGNPVPTISWTRNRSPLDINGNSSRMSFSGDKRQLTITNVNRTDSGEYRCVANNKLGNDTSNVATLNVRYPPEITTHPQNETRIEGENVTLSCNASGNPVPTISWTSSGSRVDTSNNPRISFSEGKKLLTIMNVNRTDSGEYQCVAGNNVRNVTSIIAELDIRYQAEITAHPQNKTRIEGENVTISCNADGNPVPTISWTRNGSPLDTSNNSRISFSEGKKQLNITNVSRTDSGEYQCVASNSLGNDASNAATLDVQFASEISEHPSDVTAVEGQRVVLSCLVKGNPSPSVRWTKNEERLNVTANSRLTVSQANNNHSLIVKDVRRSDAGQYRCVANNRIDNSTSSAARLVVFFQPEFTSNPENTIITEGQNVTLNCTVNGNPVPDVRWTKDGEALDISAVPRLSVSLTANTSSLTITNVVKGDQGLYRCVANNSVNTSTSDPGILTVHFLPEVTIIGLQEQFAIKGKQKLLTCQYNALPLVSEVLWKKDGTVIARNASTVINDSRVTIPHYNESQVQLSINATALLDAGNYTCHVTNDVGSSSNITVIVIQVEPHPPLNVTVDWKSSRVVNISWVAGFNGNSAIQNYIVEISEDNQNFGDAVCQGSLSNSSCIVPSSSTSASLTSLSPWTTYFIRVSARNIVGTSNSSSIVNITTDEEVPSVAPNFTVTVINSTTVDVSWQVLTKEDARGAILGYYILYRKPADAPWENKTVNGKDTTTFLVTSLDKFTIYEFAMQAFNSKGVSDLSAALQKRTAEDKPSGSPQDISVEATSSKSITVTWNPVPADHRNGVINGYKIIYRDLPSGSDTTKNISATGENEQQTIILDKLDEFTNYSIRILAFTSKGDGPLSAAQVIETQEDTPAAAPENVRGHNSSSTSILVMWDDVPAADQNGIILTYTITYESLTENHTGNVTVNYPHRQGNLTGLREFVNYSITVFASTVKGDGPPSNPIFVITDQDKPTAAPENVTAHNSSSTSILVTWDDVPAADQNGIILTYTITYESLTENHNGNVTVNYPDHQRNLTGLREYVNYSITVFASTVKGDGLASNPIFVITDQDKPTAAPENVRGHNSSSTSILVTWDDVPAADENGIILTYTITYESLTENHNGNVTVNYPDHQRNLTGLREYVNYSITVFASTVKGDGPASKPIFVITDQDKPTAAPENVRGHNSSSTSILVTWDDVPAADQNGIISTYTISYESLTENHNGNVTVNYPDHQRNLTGLRKFVNYSITVFASTVKGDGPASNPIFVITDQDKPTAAPENVTGHNTSSTSISVRWDDVPAADQNGIILTYTITYESLTENHNGNVTVNYPHRQGNLTGLREFVNYSITVFASTVKGDGPASKPIFVITDQDKPTAAPENVTGHNSSSTSILVMWNDVPAADQNGIILTYTITYESLTENHNGNVTVNYPDHQRNLTGLRKYVKYSITVFASTVKGDGLASKPIFVITDQDKPTAAPENVTGHNSSSTSISVMWDDVPAADQNGIILTYTITYESLTENHNDKVTVNYPDHQENLTGLREYVNYSITVFASTVKGDGPANNPIFVITDQDKPTAAPENVTGHNSSSTSILVMWDDVPAAEQNGIILTYTITYESLTENHNDKVTVNYPDHQATLTGLREYVKYSITVFASTVKGDGPASNPIIVITDQDKPDGAPQNVRGQNSSSTSILVKWDEVQADKQNGIITGYTITYQSQTENDNGTVPAGPDDSQKELTNLKEYVNYNITVFASTAKGDGPPSDPIIVVRTDQDKPSRAPANLTVNDTTSTSILVTWSEVAVKDRNGIITSYNVSYQAIREDGLNTSINTTKVNAPALKANLTGLIKDTEYSIRVLASTIKGDGNYSGPINVQTNQDKPGAPPQSVTGHHTSSTSISVSWGEVPADKQHGDINSYTVTYKKIPGGTDKSKTVTVKTAELDGLEKYTNYSIKVLATTMKGDGPPSEPITVSTDQDKPSQAPVLTAVTVLNSTSIQVEWEPVPSVFRHGIITKYVILYKDEKGEDNGEKDVSASSLKAVVNGLRQSTTYSFQVLAATVKGNGPASEPKSGKTQDPPTPPTTSPDDVGTTEVSVAFITKESLSNGKRVRYYQMIVTPLKEGQNPGKSSDAKYVTVTRTYDDQVEGEPYITAEFANDEPRTKFPVGDGKKYSRDGVTEAKRKRRATYTEYLNGKLDDGVKYAVFQRSFAEDGDYENEGIIEFKTNKDNTGLIVGIVVALVVVVAVIAAGIFFYRRRQNSASNGEDEEIGLKPRPRHRTLTDRIRGRGSGAFDNPNHNPGEAIPVEEFEGHVRRLHANGDLLFSQEYSALRPSADFTWNATLAQENRYKNRYNNIVSYDHSRVHLAPVTGVPGSDYINANFLDGYQKKKAYIATQGPLPETVDDFWRMVWEQGTKTIVMVTNLEERGRVKCHQYWPSEGGEAYGDIQVTLTQTVELSDFTIRTFCLKKANSRSERILNQYHYTIWPDHGVPTCATSVLTFVRKASGANPPDAGPMVVHCSAGVGRTGTFIVVDTMLQRIAAEKTVEVFGFVMSLRRDRNIMVQVEEQYVFIHEVLLEAIHSGYTEIRANDLRAHIKNLMQVNSVSGQTEMDEEFIRLGRGNNAPQSKFQSANMAYNKTKNRYANVLAFDDTRVKLSVITGIEGSDYINANFVDGYMTRRAFIATQAPIPDTIPDFWRMIWEQESSTVVMLSKETESGKVKVHRYWPAKQPANIGTLVVEMTNEMVYDDYTMREIKLTNTKESASRVVRQYHYTGWPDVGSPDSGTGLIDLIGQVQRWQQQSGNTTITVHCSAGVGRTGVFCALSILIERLKSEGVVDVFQTVKQLRAQRPAMVQTKEQYEFIYSALSEYLDSFDAYSNFE